MAEINTDPFDFANQLAELVKKNPGLTRKNLAERMGKTTAWIRDRLQLLKLDPEIVSLVRNDEINLSVAIFMSYYSPTEQLKLKEHACGVTVKDFRAFLSKQEQDTSTA